MFRRAFAIAAVFAACSLLSVAPALAVGPSSVSVGPVTMGAPGCC
jgi:hypothetical protein